ncbi:MAG: TetR/AcrR family transcriptional regulator [Candidatus Hydrogenedentes bacterium]|nr:TetR/AcrR family transcriptional regulator [Candidatus Hydrogenedentota bacterium]
MVNERTDETSTGQSSRARILQYAVAMARQVGLEGLTIGVLAKQVGMSKAGLFAHFGSKEDLQLATLEEARTEFLRAVVVPAEQIERGLPRLHSVLFDWIGMMESARDRGGCFFAAAASELDGRPGAVRDRLVEVSGQWLDWLRRQVVVAQERGHLNPDIDADQLAFELHAYGQQSNWSAQLMNDQSAFDRARDAMRGRLQTAATGLGKEMLTNS